MAGSFAGLPAGSIEAQRGGCPLARSCMHYRRARPSRLASRQGGSRSRVGWRLGGWHRSLCRPFCMQSHRRYSSTEGSANIMKEGKAKKARWKDSSKPAEPQSGVRRAAKLLPGAEALAKPLPRKRAAPASTRALYLSLRASAGASTASFTIARHLHLLPKSKRSLVCLIF